MNELEPLRRLGADVPVEDIGAKERARQRLRQRYSGVQPLPAPLRRWRGRGRWALVAAAVTVIVVAQVLLPKGSGGPATSAADALRGLALVAAEQPHPGLPPGTFLYLRSEQFQQASGEDLETGASWTAFIRVTRREWRAADGSGRILTVSGTPRFVSAADEAAWHRAGDPPLVQDVGNERYPAGSLPTHDLSGLPLDADVLRRLIERRSVVSGPPGEQETFSIVGRLLAEEEASPRFRASLLEVASSLPGVELVGETRDPVGRASVTFARRSGVDRIVLHFDAATSALLAREEVRSSTGRGENAAQWEAYWPPRIVTSLAIPADDRGPRAPPGTQR